MGRGARSFKFNLSKFLQRELDGLESVKGEQNMSKTCRHTELGTIMAKVCYYKKSGVKVQKFVSHCPAHCLPHIVSQMVSWVITGANRGIGLAFVEELSAGSSNTVFALTRNKSNSTALLELESKLKNVHVLQADITDVLSLRSVAKEVEKVTGGILDVLINNGAYLSKERNTYTLDTYDGKEDLLDDDCETFFKVNTLGVIKTINVFLPLLRKASQTSLAKIITISSGVADIELTLKTEFSVAAPYSLSKAATNMAIAKYAAKFKGENLLFLSIAPGLVATDAAPTMDGIDDEFTRLLQRIKAVAPQWNGIPLTPKQSVTAMLTTISKLTAKDSGVFLSHNGDNENWW